MYAEGLPPEVRLKALTTDGRLPFVFEASGSETHFTNGFDPTPRARRVFTVPRPETLARIMRDADADPEQPDVAGEGPAHAGAAHRRAAAGADRRRRGVWSAASPSSGSTGR